MTMLDTAAIQHVCFTGDVLRLNPCNNQIDYNGHRCQIKTMPCRLMYLLLQNAGRIISRKTLYKEIWGYDFDPGTKIIEVQVHYLRGLLLALQAALEIRTYRGRGICLQDRINPAAGSAECVGNTDVMR
ncbi:winged helix-turn-helix transcriptional regulator [Pseudomonas sp. S31]|nr:winged helix-turn-helix transcriptional regulator [Pseudomonas sp. S31]